MIEDDLLKQLQVETGENDREWIVVCSQNPIVAIGSQGDGELNLELSRLIGIRHTGCSFDGWWISGPVDPHSDYTVDPSDSATPSSADSLFFRFSAFSWPLLVTRKFKIQPYD